MSTLQVQNITDGVDTVEADAIIFGTAKGWVKFNGSGTVSIDAGFNAASITDSGTGDYAVNWTNNFVDDDYDGHLSSGAAAVNFPFLIIDGQTSGALDLGIARSTDTTRQDSTRVYAQGTGTLA